MSNDELTTIIAADYMYLIILGDEKTIGRLVNKLNYDAKKNNLSKRFIINNIDVTCAEMLDNEDIQNILTKEAKKKIKKNNKDNGENKTVSDINIDIHKKYVVIDEGIETAQCLTFAEGYKNYFMLMEIINEPTCYKVSFPILQLDEEVNPDELISDWITDNGVSDIAKDLTVKPVNIVGTDHDILVFAACVNS